MISHRPSRRSQQGQTLLIFALCAIFIFGVIGVAIDGGYGLFQQGEAQNAADFASLAVANDIAAACDNGASVSQQSVVKTIKDVIALNDPQVPSDWSAYYTDSTQAKISGTDFNLSNPDTSYGSYVPLASPNGTAPATACGITITVNPSWKTFVEGIIGFNTLSASAQASSIYKGPVPGSQLGISIVSLDSHGAHTIFMGTGTFNVTGTIAANADGIVYCETWSGTKCNYSSYPQYATWNNADVVDEKAGGTLNVNGTIQSVIANPFDGCFGSPTAGTPPYANQITCTPPWPNPVEHISYNTQLGNQGAAKDPFASYASPDAYAGCPAGSNTLNPAPDVTKNTTYYYPGTYTSPLVVNSSATQNVVFLNCLGTAPPSTSCQDGPGTAPGFYLFEQGAEILPPAGVTVSGCDVLLIGTAPLAQFAGGGVPDRLWVTKNVNGTTSNNAGYDQRFCSYCGLDTGNLLPTSGYYDGGGGSYGAFGPNYSIVLGGQGNITLSGVTDSNYSDVQHTYNQFLLWQDIQSQYCGHPLTSSPQNCAANIGLDALPPGALNTANPLSTSYSCSGYSHCYQGDSATININNSVIYDDSQPQGNLFGNQIAGNYYNSNGSNGGYPFSAGGAIVVGQGDTCGQSYFCTSGTVNVNNGVALVGRFSTDGNTQFNITGNTNFKLPGVAGSGPSLVG